MVTLICGDCNVELGGFPSESVDMLFTDLPYHDAIFMVEVIRENVGEFQWEDNLKVWRVGCNHKYKNVPHEKFKSCEWLICEKCGNKQFVDFGG